VRYPWRLLGGPVDMTSQVGSVVLKNPVLTASGTSGHGIEMAGYLDYTSLGAFVSKSLSARPWAGNPAPRLRETASGLLNSVGLQGPGVEHWLRDELPKLNGRGASVVASIWGTTVGQFEEAATMLRGAEGVVAVEVNVSCPNLEDRSRMFAHSPSATAEAVHASAASCLPLWVKLSPNVSNLVEIAAAGLGAGAEALVLVNTLLGMAINAEKWTYRLGSGPAGGGLSGPAIKPVALRAVHDCRQAFPRGAPGPGGPPVSIVGVGGVTNGLDAVELMMAGADAVEVGTASFRDPRAPLKVLAGLERWCRRHNLSSVRELIAGVQVSDARSLHEIQLHEVRVDEVRVDEVHVDSIQVDAIQGDAIQDAEAERREAEHHEGGPKIPEIQFPDTQQRETQA
jgi:dihydroorotate dehydrogenase (NAD+) catalytic subunit